MHVGQFICFELNRTLILEEMAMTTCWNFTVILSMMLLGGVVSGCARNAPDADRTGRDDQNEHGHAATGPHGGDLVELGAGDYHAEVVHGSDAVTVHVLDGTAKEPHPIDATEIVVNVRHDGQSEQFHLAPPADANAAGPYSRFSSTDAELLTDLAEGHADVEVVIDIDGKQYRGTLEHEPK
jgi:hypothetical protein